MNLPEPSSARPTDARKQRSGHGNSISVQDKLVLHRVRRRRTSTVGRSAALDLPKDKHLSTVGAKEDPQAAFRSQRAQVHILSSAWGGARSAELLQATLWQAFSLQICLTEALRLF